MEKDISNLLLLYKIDFWFMQAQAEKQLVKTWVEGSIVALVGQQEIEDCLSRVLFLSFCVGLRLSA